MSMSDYLKLCLTWEVGGVVSEYRFTATEAETIALPRRFHRHVKTIQRSIDEISEIIRSVRFLDTLSDEEINRLARMRAILRLLDDSDDKPAIEEFLSSLINPKAVTHSEAQTTEDDGSDGIST